MSLTTKVEVAGLRRRIQDVRSHLASDAEAIVDAAVRDMQETAVALAPKRTGNLAQQFARDDAIAKTVEPGKVTWRFGLITREARDKAWYWRFVELGTRGYSPGQRPAGFDRHGRARFRKVKRDIPPRKATPFLGPAFILFKQLVARIPVRSFMSDAARRRIS